MKTRALEVNHQARKPGGRYLKDFRLRSHGAGLAACLRASIFRARLALARSFANL